MIRISQDIERQLFVNELQSQLILQCLEYEWRTGRYGRAID